MGRLGGLSRQRRGRPLNAEVNIINLVDVMLVLLIIFMVTAPILQGGIQVNLPKVDTPPVTATDPLIITVERTGQLSIGDKHYTELSFTTALNVLASKHTRSVIVQGDADTPFGNVLRVLDRVQKAGIDKASLATQPANSP